MNKSSLINPYSLLGVNVDSNLSELKKNYYNMSLLCHPDKGGNDNDMFIVNKAYNYIKKQLENANQKNATYEELEDAFNQFCKEQTDETPSFSQIYEETNDWIKEFNQKFERDLNLNDITENDNVNPYENNLFGFNHGYGQLMDDSLYANNSEELDNYNQSEEENLENTVINYETKENTDTTNTFKKDIIEYLEPEPIPDTITHFPLNIETIDDYSSLTGDLKMSDYYRTFTDCDLPSKVQHNKEFNDFPTKE
tara:strand:- start:338 stop:1096 length:759 start_codon:yes stop_codon:yes gene_type:complete